MDTILNEEAIGQEILGGMYKQPEAGTYSPAIVIGLGGTGLKALRYLKRNLQRHQDSQVTLLGIDSDDSENSKWPELPALSERELIVLDQSVATGLIARAGKGHDDAEFVSRYLPDQVGVHTGLHGAVRSKIATQKGAGQFRRAGRLLFHANVSGGANVSARITTMRQSILQQAQILRAQAKGLRISPGVRIYVASSLSGGTGAGALLDCLALLRSEFNGPQDTITAFCVLPGELLDSLVRGSIDEPKVTRGNAVAMLRELQAFRTGRMADYTFQLDNHRKVGPFPLLLNDIYLVDNLSVDRTPANSYMELTQGLAQFLYVFLGAGVGATAAAGEINDKVEAHGPNRRADRIFNALGIGVIEYPIQDLAVYGVRSSLARWLNRWLTNELAPAEAKTRAEQALTSKPMMLTGTGTLRAQVLPGEDELRETKFLYDENLRKTFLKKSDEVFVGTALQKASGIDSILQGIATAFQTRADAWQADAIAHLNSWVRENVKANLADALVQLQHALGYLEGIQKKLDKESDQRRQRFEDLSAQLKSQATSIHAWDWGLDRWVRRKFLVTVSEYLDLKVLEFADSYASAALIEVSQVARALEAQLRSLVDSAAHWRRENEQQITATESRPELPGFVQRLITYDKFPQWIQARVVEELTIDAPNLEWRTILRAAVASVLPRYQSLVSSLSIPDEATASPELQQLLKTLNTASATMMCFNEDVAPMSTMSPQKFVAGAWPAASELVDATFPPAANKQKATLVQTTNPHLVACAQTCHGFAASDWRNFTSAEACYRDDPWYFHLLEDYSALPALKPLSDEEEETLRLFGLGYMFELILKRGNRYYKNLAFSRQDGSKCFYLVTASDRTEPARVLREAGLIDEPLSGLKRVDQENLLGDSLERALTGLSHGKAAKFRQELSDLVDDFKNARGAQATATLVRQFAGNHLSTEMNAATSNRELLEKIARALNEYAGRLG